MRFAHLFETIPLNQLDNPAETRLHVGGKSFQLISNAGVEQLYDPRHCFYGIAFLQYGQVAMRWRSNPVYRSLSRPGDCRIGGATIDVDPLHRGDAFPDFKIVSALRSELGWTRFRQVIAIDDPLQREERTGAQTPRSRAFGPGAAGDCKGLSAPPHIPLRTSAALPHY
jgi:hypothetical protein